MFWGVFYNQWFNNCLKTQYSVYDVLAETSSENTLPGLILGGVLGLLAGPTGALVGSTIGGTLGYNSDENERRIVDNFNRSRAWCYSKWILHYLEFIFQVQ